MRLRSLGMLLLLGLLLPACQVYAANDLLWVDGTNVRYGDSDMSPASDVVITLGTSAGAAGLPAGQGRISPIRDWGAGSRPIKYRYQCHFALVGTGQSGRVVELYAARSYDGTLMDGSLGLVDAALTAVDDRYNLQPIGQLTVDNDTADLAFTGSGFTPEIPFRWWSLVVWNSTDQAFSLKTTPGAESYCIFTPMYLRVVP